ncbi:unnamed protein product [marine sediment metagenome]|uniref:Uncharacterized protein n=1 Tax=marine sediment metagenome TaxID=412755 RepID=X0ZAA7_9ZZZZ
MDLVKNSKILSTFSPVLEEHSKFLTILYFFETFLADLRDIIRSLERSLEVKVRFKFFGMIRMNNIKNIKKDINEE